jgi:hypothetical protein
MAYAARKDFDQNLIWAWIGKLDFVDDQRFLRFDEYCSFTFGAHYSRKGGFQRTPPKFFDTTKRREALSRILS